MKWYKKEIQEQLTIVALTCDRCDVHCSAVSDQVFEYQEFVHIFISGGYGSIFGDGANLECDLCQRCAKELFGPYLRNIPEEEYEDINLIERQG